MKSYPILIILALFTFLAYGQSVEINGKIEHPTAQYIFFQKNGRNYITGNTNDKYTATVDRNGSFHITLKTRSIDEWALRYGDDVALIDLKPGDKLSINFTQFDYYSGYVINGEGANDIYFKRGLFDDSTYKEQYSSKFNTAISQSKSLSENLDKRIEKAKFKLSFLEKYNVKHPLSGDFYRQLKNEFTYEPYERFCVATLLQNKIIADDKLLELFWKVNINNDEAAKCSANYNDVVQYFCALKTSGNLRKYRPSEVFNYGIKNLKGPTKDILLTRQLLNIVAIDSIFTKLYPDFINTVKSPDLKNLVDNKRTEYLKFAAEAKHDIDKISHYTDLNTIFGKYAGKVIYIDFWASWCIPCRSEMPNSKILQDKLKDQNVVFVFLGYNDSKANWLSARKQLNIQGEHYFLDTKLIEQANNVFNILGIPHYAIIDQKGQIISKDATRPGDDYTLSNLLKLL